MKTLFLLFILGFAMQAEAATTALWFWGDQQSLVRGEEKYFDLNNAEFTIRGYTHTGLVAGDLEYFSFSVDSLIDSSDWWRMTIAPAPSHDTPLLGEGAYRGAGRMVRSEGRPEIDFYGRGSGYNQTYGYFEIFEIGRDQEGKINQIAFDFAQLEERPSDSFSGLIVGSFRFNSDYPIPEPSTITLLSLTLLGLRRNRH